MRTVIALVAGAALALAGCASTTDNAASSSATTPASPGPTPPAMGSTETPTKEPAAPVSQNQRPPADKPVQTGNAILDGERQIVITPVDTYETVLHVDDRGHLALTDGGSATTLFVLVPVVGEKHWIRTAKADSTGEQSCIGLKAVSNGHADLDAAPCDASAKGQLFTVVAKGKSQYAFQGDKNYTIRAMDETGVEAQVGASGQGTTFTFADNGKAPAGPGQE